MAQTLCVYQPPIERWNGRGFDRAFVSFETVLEKGKTAFYISVPADTEPLARKAIETAWPKVSVEKAGDPLGEKPILTSVLELNYHYMFAIRVDRRQIGALSSILETLNMMEKGEKIYIQSLAIPAEPDWYQGAAQAYEQFKQGDMPQKLQLNKQALGKTGLKLAAGTVLGTISIMTELITGEEPEKIRLNEGERAMILRDGQLRRETLQKVRGDAYDVSIRVGVCAPHTRAKALMRMVTMAFRELDGDNFLKVREANVWRKMRERKMPFRLQKDYMSIPEVSRLFVLPTGKLQEKYRLESIRTLETDIPNRLLQDGIKFGTYTYKSQTKPVYMPTDNHDELCLPRVVIGGMGSGKTRGFGANWMVEAVRNGFGALAVDPAKGEIGDEVATALPAEKVIRIRLGEKPVALDWCEVKHSTRARNRLANTIISFFNTATDEAGAQTARYIRAAVMAMQTGKLSEIMRILEDTEYRGKMLERMPDSIHKTTLQTFGQESEARARQIMAPIYNRLDTILGDVYLAECMESDQSIDMVDLMSQRKAVVIDVPKSELGPEAVDLIVNLLSTKIDLAMTLRAEENQFPFFVLFDEPHQFIRSARTWKSAAVESRKWRIGYVWLFHSWEQIPRDLAGIIKDAGPHYHLYMSSKRTFQDLREEIMPFTVEDALKLKRFHAINILRTGGEVATPFIAHMSPPPRKV